MGVGKTHAHTDLNPSAARFVKKHVYELTDLPEPGEKWTSRAVPYGPQRILRFRNEGIIIRIYNGERSDDGRKYYRTKPEGYEAVQTFLEQVEKSDGFLPCGHDAFENLGDRLECNRCGEVHDKEVVRNG